MGSVWSRLGTKVSVVEYLDHITPGMDKEISKEFQKILSKQGIEFKLSTKVSGVIKDGDELKVEIIDNKSQKKISLKLKKF